MNGYVADTQVLAWRRLFSKSLLQEIKVINNTLIANPYKPYLQPHSTKKCWGFYCSS